MQIPPEAWTSLGYVLGGLLLVAIMRRGDVESVTNKALTRLVEKKTAGVMAPSGPTIPMTLLGAGAGSPDPAIKLMQLLLERLSRDLDEDRIHNRDQFTRLWNELALLKKGDTTSKDDGTT